MKIGIVVLVDRHGCPCRMMIDMAEVTRDRQSEVTRDRQSEIMKDR